MIIKLIFITFRLNQSSWNLLLWFPLALSFFFKYGVQSQLFDSSPTCFIRNLFSLITRAQSATLELPVKCPWKQMNIQFYAVVMDIRLHIYNQGFIGISLLHLSYYYCTKLTLYIDRHKRITKMLIFIYINLSSCRTKIHCLAGQKPSPNMG